MRPIRIIIGICLWAGLLAGAAYSVNAHLDKTTELRGVIPDLVNYWQSDEQTVALTFDEALPLKVGDPILRVNGANEYEQIGEVRLVREVDTQRIVDLARTRSAEAVLFARPNDSLRISELDYFHTPNSLDWVVVTMMSPQKQQEVIQVIQQAVDENRDSIVAQLKPVMRRSLQDALVVVEDDLIAALRHRQSTLAAIGGRYQNEVLQKELVPLVKSEILPIVQHNAEPLVQDIGLALWQRLSLWRFTWRYLYDVSPLPERNKFKREWDRFVKQDAVPELEGRSEEILRVVQDTVKEVAANDKVKRVVRSSAKKVMNDEEIHALVWDIFREVIVDNQRLHDTIEATWKTPEARRALKITGAKLQPHVTEIGRLLFGSPEDGITPEFASVLRNKILQKDRRWLVVRPADRANEELPVGTAPVTIESNQEIQQSQSIRVKRGPATVHNPFAEAAALRDIKRGQRVRNK